VYLEDNHYYIGHVKREGFGELFKNPRPEKQGGDATKQNQLVFSGHWANDKREGKGKKWFDNGDIYDGEWANDLMSGQGTLTTAAGDKYFG